MLLQQLLKSDSLNSPINCGIVLLISKEGELAKFTCGIATRTLMDVCIVNQHWRGKLRMRFLSILFKLVTSEAGIGVATSAWSLYQLESQNGLG